MLISPFIFHMTSRKCEDVKEDKWKTLRKRKTVWRYKGSLPGSIHDSKWEIRDWRWFLVIRHLCFSVCLLDLDLTWLISYEVSLISGILWNVWHFNPESFEYYWAIVNGNPIRSFTEAGVFWISWVLAWYLRSQNTLKIHSCKWKFSYQKEAI